MCARGLEVSMTAPGVFSYKSLRYLVSPDPEGPTSCFIATQPPPMQLSALTSAGLFAGLYRRLRLTPCADRCALIRILLVGWRARLLAIADAYSAVRPQTKR